MESQWENLLKFSHSLASLQKKSARISHVYKVRTFETAENIGVKFDHYGAEKSWTIGKIDVKSKVEAFGTSSDFGRTHPAFLPFLGKISTAYLQFFQPPP